MTNVPPPPPLLHLRSVIIRGCLGTNVTKRNPPDPPPHRAHGVRGEEGHAGLRVEARGWPCSQSGHGFGFREDARLIQAAIEQLFAALAPLLVAARSVLFTEVSGKLMVNGKEAHGASFGQAPAVLLRRLSQRGITTLAIKEGVTPNELIRLLSALAREDIGLQGHKAWEA